MIYNICMAKVKLPQVRGKIYNICIAKLRMPQVRGGYTTNVVYPPLTCATVNVAIQLLYIFPLTCGNLTLAIQMLYILLLPVAL
jgi:hypothetical protein